MYITKMKILALVALVAFTAGCSSTSGHKQAFIEGAEACNSICINNPEVGEYSYTSWRRNTFIVYRQNGKEV